MSDLLSDGRLMLSAFPMPVFLLDDDDIIIAANDASEDFLSRSKNHIEGSSIKDIIRIEDSDINDILWL